MLEIVYQLIYLGVLLTDNDSKKEMLRRMA